MLGKKAEESSGLRSVRQSAKSLNKSAFRAKAQTFSGGRSRDELNGVQLHRMPFAR